MSKTCPLTQNPCSDECVWNVSPGIPAGGCAIRIIALELEKISKAK